MIEQTSQVEETVRQDRPTVLISGGGFAGLATAYWMNRLGYRVTIVERATLLRKGGSPVDIEGETVEILTRMGLIEAIRAKTLPPRRLQFMGGDDNTLGEMLPEPEEYDDKHEIHRDDLLAILFGAVVDDVEIVFGQSITQLEDKPGGVAVTFKDGSLGEYALVIGCDGNRSTTRKLTFGAAENFSHFMGGYFFIKVVPHTDLVPGVITQIYSVPGRTALLNGYVDRTDIALVFRSDVEIDYDYRDRVQQLQMIQNHFAGLGWKVPKMLSHIDVGDEFYFDKVNQIRMPIWSKGRVVLVGDAGYCVSPVAGMGGSMAIIGAARLADALAQRGTDYAGAFQAYHDGLAPFVKKVQDRAVNFGMAMMFPASEAEIAERNRKLTVPDHTSCTTLHQVIH